MANTVVGSASSSHPPLSREQELVDRLVTAVLEQDVLYVRVWRDEMQQEGMLKLGVGKELPEWLGNKHSRLSMSALEAAITRPYTDLSLFILQLLLQGMPFWQLMPLVPVAGAAQQLWSSRLLSHWERGEGDRAVQARLFLGLSIDEAADWIDANLPPHPDPANCTGYVPFPPRPAVEPPSPDPPAVAAPSRPATSSALPPPIPSVAPPVATTPAADSTCEATSPPPEWGHPSCQIRLSAVPPSFLAADVCATLPKIVSLLSLNKLSSTEWILTYPRPTGVNMAMQSFHGQKTGIVIEREVDFQASVAHRPASSAASESLLLPPMQPTTFEPPKPYTANAGPSSVNDRGTWVSLKSLPLDATLDEAISLFAFAGVTLHGGALQQHPGAHTTFCNGYLASLSDFAAASRTLHWSNLRGRKLYLNRKPAVHFLASHPFVVVHGLPAFDSEKALVRIAKSTGCGAYGFAPLPKASGQRQSGTFRVESVVEAKLAVWHLNAKRPEGVTAEWRAASALTAAAPLWASSAALPPAQAIVPPSTLSAGRVCPPPPPPLPAPAPPPPAPLKVTSAALPTPAPDSPPTPSVASPPVIDLTADSPELPFAPLPPLSPPPPPPSSVPAKRTSRLPLAARGISPPSSTRSCPTPETSPIVDGCSEMVGTWGGATGSDGKRAREGADDRCGAGGEKKMRANGTEKA
ncbi:hypothetical protein JCM10207_003168 [Rhodosporidiobolus poonsookiae]